MSTVFVTVGTDHHPFARLMSWVQRLATDEPTLTFVVQHGDSEPPPGCITYAMLRPQDFEDVLSRADVVVTHGGPGSIIDAHASGHRPVVVPREHRFGEHVDDHQVRFTRRLAAAGDIDLARDEDGFRRAVLGALLRERFTRSGSVPGMASEVLLRFEGLVDARVRGKRHDRGRKPHGREL